MKWAVQTTLIDLDASNKIGDAALEIGCDLVPVYIQPFASELPEMDVGPEEDVIFYGSTKLVTLVSDAEFNPGVWYDDEVFQYEYHIECNGTTMLNFDAKISTLGEYIHDRAEPFFVRPLGDLKQFSGMLIDTPDDLREWQKKLSMAGLSEFQETPILVSSPKNIFSEYRCFVVGGKIIDATSYKSGDQVIYHRINETIVSRLQSFLDTVSLPMPVVVADIAHIGDEKLKIIEFNCFNASGFYNHDIPKIVKAVTEYSQ